MSEESQNWLVKKIGKGMIKGIDLATGKDVSSIRDFVDNQRKLHPELSDNPDKLADRIIKKKQWYASATSFAGTRWLVYYSPRSCTHLENSRQVGINYFLYLWL